MKKTILLFMLCCLPKVIAQKANVATGGNATGSGGTVSYSVGQVTYKSVTGSNGNINQGVQQPFEIFTLGSDDFPEITLQMTVYPNPTTSFINLNIQNLTLDTIEYQLFDTNGKQITSQKITQSETQIAMENLPAAIYLLNVSNNKKTLKSFKIIKN